MLSRRLLTVGAIATLTLALGLTGSASARDPGAECPPSQTNCDVWDDIPGGPGGPGGGGPGGGGPGGGGPARKCNRDGVAVPCYDDVLGWFNSVDKCYYKLAEPQAPEVPEGMDAYVVSCAGAGAITVMLAEPPPGYGAPPDPADIAAELMDSINMYGLNVGIAPDPDKGAGLVGLPIWLWAKPDDSNSLKSTWGPIAAGKTERGVTVWIEAKVEKAVWNMGNRAYVTCNYHGDVYDPLTDKDERPRCGYTGYPKPSADGAKYKVSATTTWKVRWGVGANGANEGDPMYTTRQSNTVLIEIDELQVVTR